ncbi:hypothetical protein OsI_31645 [Oryza sativa Indica Group]|uniref:Uncharacterized protein n=1 Tax=Oryza sativa subsp. indica TaxID=39946 RepID=A2Z211_ORYSI|nr:hypothetical protein OsI_31645 [Oryza sativa Indica Group]
MLSKGNHLAIAIRAEGPKQPLGRLKEREEPRKGENGMEDLGSWSSRSRCIPLPLMGLVQHKNNLTMPSPTREVAATYKIRIEHPSCCYHVGDQNSKVEMQKGQSSDGETVGSKGGHGPGWYDPDSPQTTH